MGVPHPGPGPGSALHLRCLSLSSSKAKARCFRQCRSLCLRCSSQILWLPVSAQTLVTSSEAFPGRPTGNRTPLFPFPGLSFCRGVTSASAAQSMIDHNLHWTGPELACHTLPLWGSHGRWHTAGAPQTSAWRLKPQGPREPPGPRPLLPPLTQPLGKSWKHWVPHPLELCGAHPALLLERERETLDLKRIF